MRQEEYPAITKAQRLTAERLGPAARSQQCGTDEQQRPLASMTESHQQPHSAAYSGSSGAAADPTVPTASIVHQESAGVASKSTWMWDASTTRATVRDHRRSRALAAAKVGLQQEHQQQHDRRAQTAADPKYRDPPRSRGRSRTCKSRKAPLPYLRKSCRREVECLWSDGESSESARSTSSSGSQSPPPPLPPPRLGVERARSPERSFVDIGQITRSIREEARAFDVFLSVEVEPLAQKLFDSATLHHAKACRLLHKGSLPQLVALEGDAAQQSARRRGRTLHKTNAAAGVVPAAPAAPDDALPPAPPPVRSASQPRPSRGYLSDSTGASLNVSGNSSTSTNIWLQAVRAGVIEVGPPPTVGSRATLPARRSAAAAAATGPIGTTKAQRDLGASAGAGGDGGDGGAGGQVGKGNGRARDEEGSGRGAEQEPAREPRKEEIATACGGGGGDSGGGGNLSVLSVAAGWGSGPGEVAARQREFPQQEVVGYQDEEGEDDENEDEDDDLDDDEEEDEGWDVSLSKMVAAEINNKIVGLSSIIRQKAAESAKARRKQVR